MTTLTSKRLEQIANFRNMMALPPSHTEIEELARIALAAMQQEPVSLDDLRDAVAEVSGSPAMEWSDIYKGHQVVPFINFNSLARIVDKFRSAKPAPVVPDEIDVNDPALDTHRKWMAEGWNRCRAAMLNGGKS